MKDYRKEAEEYLKDRGLTALSLAWYDSNSNVRNLEDLMVGFAQSQQSKVDVDRLINSLGTPVGNNEYIIKSDKDGVWWIEHKHIGSGEPLEQFLSQEDTKEEKESQKQNLINMMKADEESGIYKVKEDSNVEGWISVEDEEPEPLSKCLIYIKDQDIIVNGSLEWDDTWTVQYTGEEVEGVTHWMPLPKPPKNN